MQSSKPAVQEENEGQLAFDRCQHLDVASRGYAATGTAPPAWERCNSDDPSTARQLAVAVEDKLKLAPILAKRLERVSHSSGSFSSRQSVSVVNAANPSGRNTPQRRVSGGTYNDYGKFNYLLTSLEGVRGERNLKVEGSARLPQVLVREPNGSPTTSARGNNSHSFDEAKKQVDRDLRLFVDDVRELCHEISQREGADVAILLEVIESIMAIAEECLDSPIEDFRVTITDVVDDIEEKRSTCQQRTIRALYTRLLFILTRCSRLLITEQQHLFATEPRNRRRHSQVFGPGFTTKTQKELGLHLPPPDFQLPDASNAGPKDDEPVFRSHTMPVKAMYSMAQRLKQEQQASATIPKVAWTEGPELCRQTTEIPRSPATVPSASGEMFRHHSQSSDLEGFAVASDASMGPLGKKKKSVFNKIAKGFKNLADGFKRKSSTVKEKVDGEPSGSLPKPDGLSRHQSEATQSHVRFRMSSDASRAESPSTSRRNTRSGVPEPSDGSAAATRKFEQQRSVRFQEAPVIILGESGNGGSAGGAGPGPGSSGDGAGDGDTGKRAKLMIETDMQAFNQQLDIDGGRASNPSPATSQDLVTLAGNAAAGGGKRLFRRASVDLFALGLGPSGEPISPGVAPPPEELAVVCSICEENWLSTQLEEHSIHCAVLRTLSGNGLSVDAQLTTIANVLEEWLETPLAFPALGPAPSHYHVKNQLIKLIKAARNAAALQPDGSKVPTTRCFSLYTELAEMLEEAAQANKLAVVTQTYGHRIMRLTSDKVSLLAEPFSRGARTRGTGSDAGDSGTSTPRSMPGMSIDEFEILKPISRGAFGRVYLARKLATGDLFAIKVMKKRDLIRKNMVESVTNERNILAMAQNPFVVRFYYSFTSRENLYIVMEYINGGDCFSLLRKFGALDEEVARQYIAETVLALEYCHAQGIIHRDLKPDNLLINAQGHVKLTDFGLSCVGVIDRTDNLNGPQPMDTDAPAEESEAGWAAAEPNGEYAGGAEPMDASKGEDDPGSYASVDGGTPASGGATRRVSAAGQGLGATAASSLGLPPRPVGQHQRIVAPERESRRAVGTPDYLAPELLLGTGHGPEVDWWALGAILYEFVTGTPPFNAESPEAIFDNILDRRITWPDEDDMTSECRDLIDKLLHPNPLKRLGHRGAGEVKLHPWFEGLDWTGLVRNKAAFIPTIEDETDTSYFESKHVSQRSMAEDLDRLRTSLPGQGASSAAADRGPNSGTASMHGGPGSAPHSGMGGARTQVDRLKDQYHRENSGLRSVGSSNSHASHMSRTSYTGGQAPPAAGNVYSGAMQPASAPDSMDVGGVVRTGPGGGYQHPQQLSPLLPPGLSLGGPDSSSGPFTTASAIQYPRGGLGSSSGAGMRNSGNGARNSGSGARNSASGVRNSANGARNSGSGAQISGSGARNSGSGARGSASGSAGATGTLSDRPSPGSASGTMPGGDPASSADLRGDGGYVLEADEVEAYQSEVEEEEQQQHESLVEGEEDLEELSPSGGEEGDTLEFATGDDPFGNFSFTNFTGLSAANMEKIQKLREHFNRRPSYAGPGN